MPITFEGRTVSRTDPPADLKVVLAVPEGAGPWPGVVLVHEIFGLDEQNLRHAERLAAAGYLVAAPNLFGHANRLRCLVQTFSALRAGQGRAFDDLETARGLLAADDRCTGAVGVIGFCVGGGFALLLSTRGYAASSVNYGPPPDDLAAAVRDACPIVASYGGQDRGMPGVAARLETALTEAGVPHDVKEYPTAGHAFLNEKDVPLGMRPFARVRGVGPDPESAADAWARIEAFFETHLRGERASVSS